MSNILEKDIEQYLFENPEAVRFSFMPKEYSLKVYNYVSYWITRQYDISCGILDLFGVDNELNFVVVEVKRGPIDSSALAQVCRYASDLTSAIRHITGSDCYQVKKVIVGKSVSTKTLIEAESLEVLCSTIDIERDVLCIPASLTINDKFSHEKRLKRIVLDEFLRSEVENVRSKIHESVRLIREIEVEQKDEDVINQVETLLSEIDF